MKTPLLHFAHHLRELAGIAELTGQVWPTTLAELLVELHIAVEVAKADGTTKLSARRLATFGERYDALIVEGNKLNPPPPRTGKRGRPALGAAGSLLARLETHRADVLRFATDPPSAGVLWGGAVEGALLERQNGVQVRPAGIRGFVTQP